MILQIPLFLAVAAAAPAGGIAAFLSGPGQLLPLAAIMVLFYVMILMPQQRRQKQHASKIAGVKRGMASFARGQGKPARQALSDALARSKRRTTKGRQSAA